MSKRRGRPRKEVEPINRPENPIARIGGQYKRCPRCGTMNTVAYCTTGEVVIDGRAHTQQYRKCRQPICRNSFKTFKPE